MVTTRNSRGKAARALPVLALLLSAPAALAQPADPATEGFIAVQHVPSARKYSFAGKSELGFFATVPVPTPLTEHYGVAVNYAMHFSDLLALDVHVGGGFPRVPGLVGDIRNRSFASEPASRVDFSNSIGILAHGQVGLRLTPVYGKLSLAGELPVHFNLYGTVSAGGALVRFESVLKCAANPVGGRCPNDQFFSETYGTPVFGFGFGARFFVNDKWSVRVEVRDVLLPDHRYGRVTPSGQIDGGFNPRSPVNTPGTLDTTFSLVQQPLVFLGAGMAL